MGRRRSDRQSRTRVTSDNANRRLRFASDDLLDRLVSSIRPRSVGFTPIEDRRTWHPEGSWRPARSFNQSRHRLVVGTVGPQRNVNGSASRRLSTRFSFQSPPAAVAFGRPDSVLVCVRRKMRREVMHALQKTGRGRGRQKRPRRNWTSGISCRSNRRRR